MEAREALKANEAFWDEEVERGVGCTVPWLDLDPAVLRRFAKGELDPVPKQLANRADFPGIDLADIEGKEVLCLGAGGGQQSAVFGLLGARVTMVDLSGKQLDGDRRAAAHYGYEITAIRGDMQDLSCLGDESFDIVYATGVCYVPDARRVYSESARVMRPNAVLTIGFGQPAIQCIAADETGYRISRPYCVKADQREDGAIEFRHYMDDIFNGLLDAGLSLERVFDDHGDEPSPGAPVGSWTHESAYINGYFIIVARKPDRTS